MDHRRQVQEFLVSRRARISPESVGLPVAGRQRRVPGLRREEAASLAGLSVDYYVRLERGALASASDGVLHAIARALRLDDAEEAHLVNLARNGQPTTTPARVRAVPHGPPVIASSLQAVLDALVSVPALVRSPALDVLAANDLGRALYSEVLAGSSAPVNLARFVFLDPRAHRFWRDWQQTAHDCAALLQAAAGRDPYDRDLSDLVGQLSTRSEAFRQLWARRDVRGDARGLKRIHHAVVGDLDLTFEVMEIAAEPGLTLIAYTAEAGSGSEDGLSLLASWAATHLHGTDPQAAHGGHDHHDVDGRGHGAP